jgi:transposase
MSRTTKSQNSRKAPVRRAGRNSTTQASSCAESPAPRSAPAELIKLGVDTHAGHYTFARMVDNQNAQPAQKLSPEQFLEFLARQKTLARRVVMVYEAGPYGFSLYRQVTAMGVECVVCAPERLSRGRKRINDKIDAKELLSRLDRHLAGNTTALRMVRPPTIEQEMSRREARERNTYRKDRQRWIARGRSLLHTLGIARPGRWWEMDRFLELKKILLERYGQTVADGATAELDRYLEFVHLAAGKLEALTVVLQKSAEEKKLPRIKGIGPLSSELLDREIGDWNRFANRRQVASYTGLCPGEESSGDTRMLLGIDKHGNPRVRAVLVELAWLLPRYQPDYKPLARWKWVFDPRKKASAAMKKKAAVALARRLAVDLWRLRTGRVRPEDVGLCLTAA